eukprot:sb/3472181/
MYAQNVGVICSPLTTHPEGRRGNVSNLIEYKRGGRPLWQKFESGLGAPIFSENLTCKYHATAWYSVNRYTEGVAGVYLVAREPAERTEFGVLEVYLVHDRRECAKCTKRVSGTLALYHELKDKQQLLVQQQKQREIMIKMCIVYLVREIRVCLAKDAVLLVISETRVQLR